MLFASLGTDLRYTDLLQLDGAFSLLHSQYGETPKFNGEAAVDIFPKIGERIPSLSEDAESLINEIHSFNGTVKDGVDGDDQSILWKYYWIEYINAFDKMTEVLPESIVTAYIGRHAVELGFKYLMYLKKAPVKFTHDLSDLYTCFSLAYDATEEYLKCVGDFCHIYSEQIEGKVVEYFRFPKNRGNSYFAGVDLDVRWLSYSFALIILKLMHVAKLEKW